MWLAFVTVLLSFGLMEVASWAIHKYVMHGPLWFIHKTHHGAGHHWLELNDVFTIFFGGVAVVLMILGAATLDVRFWIGIGISLYGLVYFLVHDLFIHRRMNVFGRSGNRFLNRLYRAHQIHHRSRDRDRSKAFGLLWVNDSVFDEEPPRSARRP
ncbi:beta-carotene 3-hydroxylase [Catalinimonas alkaloidigena]|uniref:Beta-carotene 3-hydroxylase n=1 Tax=Catalinimonas alkaloidigena TaxID=1075417 RepID=A0A1G9DMS0_9BACT|nr:sterol desaturase family protein [Catalinimonas alkaloidigena]SDK65153.1 beta-carotene 3-hydroxylase [Catalinimonas alkaloidigena]